MTIEIPDWVLADNGLDEPTLRIEIACRLFAAELIQKPEACAIANLNRAEFEKELVNRDLPIMIYTMEMLKEDVRTLQRLREEDVARRQ